MFERLMKNRPNSRYDHIGDFLDEKSLEILKAKVLECIKEQKYCSTKLDIKDRREAFQCNLQPIYWKGSKRVSIVIKNIMDVKMRHKMVANQSDEISNQFHLIISQIEKEISEYEENKKRYYITKDTLKSLLLSSSKCFNDFLFIKNIFEFDSGNIVCNYEDFSIKDFFIYSVNLLLNKTEQRNVSLTVDPMLPEEVRGDLNKFRQIITAILEFSLKSTDKIDVQIQANFVLESGGYIIQFKISFMPQFELKEDELMLIFSSSDDETSSQYKIDKNVGLPIYVISKLIKSIGGSFKNIKKDSDDKVCLDFSLPFSLPKSRRNIVKTPQIKIATQRASTIKGKIVLKSPYDPMRRTIKAIGSDMESEKSFPGLPQIDEKKSESNSVISSKNGEISSIRENIMNFESSNPSIMKRNSSRGSSNLSRKSSKDQHRKEFKKKIPNPWVSHDSNESYKENSDENPNLVKYASTTSLQKSISEGMKPYKDNEINLGDDSPNHFPNMDDFQIKKLRHPQVDKVRKQLIRENSKKSKSNSQRLSLAKRVRSSDENNKRLKSFQKELQSIVSSRCVSPDVKKEEFKNSQKESNHLNLVERKREPRKDSQKLGMHDPNLTQTNSEDQGWGTHMIGQLRNSNPFEPAMIRVPSFSEFPSSIDSIVKEHDDDTFGINMEKYSGFRTSRVYNGEIRATKALINAHKEEEKEEANEYKGSLESDYGSNYFSEIMQTQTKSLQVISFQKKILDRDTERMKKSPTRMWKASNAE